MKDLTVENFVVGQEVIVANDDGMKNPFKGVIIDIDKSRHIGLVRVSLIYNNEEREVTFKNTGTPYYLYQYSEHKDHFRGYLFPSQEKHSDYVKEFNRIKAIRHKLDIIKSKYETVNALEEGRVFEVYIPEEREDYLVVEKCDEYFGKVLSKEEFLELSNYFADIADLMKENGH